MAITEDVWPGSDIVDRNSSELSCGLQSQSQNSEAIDRMIPRRVLGFARSFLWRRIEGVQEWNRRSQRRKRVQSKIEGWQIPNLPVAPELAIGNFTKKCQLL